MNGRQFQIQILNIIMHSQLTDFLLRLTFQREDRVIWTRPSRDVANTAHFGNSQQLLDLIFENLHSSENNQNSMLHKSSLSSEDTDVQSLSKCKCKKSQCLKLYCECFARGSYCKGCGCDCCKNTNEFGQVRSKAIDEMMAKASLSFGHKKSMKNGCNCKKSGCQKKYCECFGQGVSCGDHCNCINCINH